MTRLRAFYTALVSILASLFGRTASAAVPAPTPVVAEATAHSVKNDPATRSKRIHYGILRASGRVGFGKHFGSKRKFSNHRGTGRGKRSGRS